MRKRFNCGHRGFGKFCHRCNRAKQLEQYLADEKKNFDLMPSKMELGKMTIQQYIGHLRALPIKAAQAVK